MPPIMIRVVFVRDKFRIARHPLRTDDNDPVRNQYGAWHCLEEFLACWPMSHDRTMNERKLLNSVNCYEDANRANAYATLEFANTYYLAFRNLPGILTEHVTGKRALDFGCGTGRSTRLLQRLGFDVTGVDISEDMLRIARATDPSGNYRLVPGDNLDELAAGSFDLVLSAFPFDNIPGGMKARISATLEGCWHPMAPSSTSSRHPRFTPTNGRPLVPGISLRT